MLLKIQVLHKYPDVQKTIKAKSQLIWILSNHDCFESRESGLIVIV